MKTRNIALIAVLLLIVSAGFKMGFLMDEEIEIVDNSTEAVAVTEPLNFQGEKDNVRLRQNALELDTHSVIEEENLTSGHGIAAGEQNLYVVSNDGGIAKWIDNEKKQLGFDSTYGMVTGDFDYPGFNIVYADNSRNVYIRNLATNEEEKIVSNALEVLKTDSDNDGVPESAAIRLMNGSTLHKKPVDGQLEREDLDSDGYKERIYIKQGSLHSYDKKHGEEKLASANSFDVMNKEIYAVDTGKIKKISINQVYRKNGTYTSPKVEFNETVEIVQLITDTRLNGGEITASIITNNQTEKFEIRGGTSEKKVSLEADEAQIELNLKSANTDTTPKILRYNLRIKR
jgi:hypothetical protein